MIKYFKMACSLKQITHFLAIDPLYAINPTKYSCLFIYAEFYTELHGTVDLYLRLFEKKLHTLLCRELDFFVLAAKLYFLYGHTFASLSIFYIFDTVST